MHCLSTMAYSLHSALCSWNYSSQILLLSGRVLLHTRNSGLLQASRWQEERRDHLPAFFLSPALSHQLCLLVLMPAVGHRLQLILRLLEAQRMSPQGAAVGANAFFFVWFEIPCIPSCRVVNAFHPQNYFPWLPQHSLFPSLLSYPQ